MAESTQPVILTCVTDSPSARRVIQCSALWAKAMELPVRFVHFGQLADAGTGRLNELIALEAGGASLEIVHSPRPVADAIRELASKLHAEMIVIGALQREAAVRDLVGSTARRVARRAPCSVLLVSTSGRGAPQWSRFAIGVDFTPASKELATIVLRAARGAGAQSEVWFAYEYRGYKHDAARATAPHPPIDSSLHTAGEQYQLSSFIGALDTEGVAARAVTLPGRPGQEIARYAEDIHADLLGVMAPSRPLGALDRLLSHPIILLLDQLPCSVLLYRPTRGSSA